MTTLQWRGERYDDLGHVGEFRAFDQDWWVVCEHPERPLDPGAFLCHPQRGCRACIVAAEAALARGDGPSWLAFYLRCLSDPEVSR